MADGETPDEMRQILQEVRSLHHDFQTKLLYDDAKQKQLDTMHAEIQGHRRGMHFQLLRPVFTDLIALLDNMTSVSARLRREQGDDSGATAQATILDQFREQIEETLRRNGVEAYTISDAAFDRERQRAIGVVETNDPALDKQVAARVHPGYVYEGRIVVQTEQVKTYRYTPPAAVSAPPS